MDLRIALVGSDPLRLKALEAELHLEGAQTVTATSAETLAPQFRQLHPVVIMVLADLADAVEAQRVAQLLIHPATSSTPISVVSPRVESRAAVRAFRSGVIDVVIGAPQGKVLLESVVRLIGATDDDPRRRAAIDRRGPTVLRRIGDFLRAHKADGVLAIRGENVEAKMQFVGGQIRTAESGSLQGGEAIRHLLADPTQAPWDFLLVTEAEIAAASAEEEEEEVVVLLDEIETDFDLDIDVDDMPSSPGMPVVEGAVMSRLRVLLTDDDPDLLTLYSAFMKKQGWEIETAQNGRRGYDMAVMRRPDVIVSDIMMPETDGWGFLTSVRGDYRLREIPFLLLSCHGEYLHNLENLDAGANDYLEKGLRGDEVVERIERAANPRANFIAACDPGVAMSGSLEETGAALLLRELSTRKATGTLQVRSGWVEATLLLDQGRTVGARAKLGDDVDENQDALRRYLGLDAGSYTWLPGTVSSAGMMVFYPDVADELAITLNKQREEEQEHLMAGDAGLMMHDSKLAFYERVCADPIRPITDRLRQGQSPRMVMRDSGASPLLVEWVVKDLLRKGIARFQ